MFRGGIIPQLAFELALLFLSIIHGKICINYTITLQFNDQMRIISITMAYQYTLAPYFSRSSPPVFWKSGIVVPQEYLYNLSVCFGDY